MKEGEGNGKKKVKYRDFKKIEQKVMLEKFEGEVIVPNLKKWRPSKRKEYIK